MGTRAPNCCPTGSQALDQKKLKPKVWNTARPPHSIDKAAADRTISTSTAAAVVSQRKPVSATSSLDLRCTAASAATPIHEPPDTSRRPVGVHETRCR